MMSRVKMGLMAGFCATVAVSVLEAVNQFGLKMFDPFPGVVAALLGMPGNLAVGWVAHFLAGTIVLGGLFGYLYPRLPTDTAETKGIVFAVAAFVVMMLGVFLIGNYATFSGSADFGNIAWMLVTHVVFGIVMGNVYGRLAAREKRMALDGHVPAH